MGGADERGGATQADFTKTRNLIARALAISGALFSRARSGKRRTRSVSRTMTALGWIAAIALCLYVGVATMMYLAQRSLMYFPDTTRTTPAAAGLPEAEEVPLVAVGRRAHPCLARSAARRQTGHRLLPRQWRFVALSRRALS